MELVALLEEKEISLFLSLSFYLCLIPHMHALKKGHVRTQKKDGHLQGRKRTITSN